MLGRDSTLRCIVPGLGVMSAALPLQQVFRRARQLVHFHLDRDGVLPPAVRRLLRRALVRRRTTEPQPRHYLPAELGVSGLFAELRRLRTQYVVLRWFERLPQLPAGNDIDLLVTDEDLPVLTRLLQREEGDGLVPCDVYAVGGPVGARYAGIPYYPPHLSQQILSRAEDNGFARVPCRQDHFLSLAFHAVYQKGAASGLPTSTPGVTPHRFPRHDYAGVLASLAAELSLAVPITMETLDEELARRGWRPPSDMLERLGEGNRWIRRRFASD